MLTTTEVIPASAWPELPLCLLHLPARVPGTELTKLLSPAFSMEIHKSGYLLYQLLIVAAKKGKKTETPHVVYFDSF